MMRIEEYFTKYYTGDVNPDDIATLCKYLSGPFLEVVLRSVDTSMGIRRAINSLLEAMDLEQDFMKGMVKK